MGFGPLGTSCSLALKILFCHFNGGSGARELPLLGSFKRSSLVVCFGVISVSRFCELPSLAEASAMMFLFFAPSFMEAKVDKLRSGTAIAKWNAKSKENKRVIMEVFEGKAASPAMQNEVLSTNHPRSINSLSGRQPTNQEEQGLRVYCMWIFLKLEMAGKIIFLEKISRL